MEIEGQNDLHINKIFQIATRVWVETFSFESSLVDYPLGFPDPLDEGATVMSLFKNLIGTVINYFHSQNVNANCLSTTEDRLLRINLFVSFIHRLMPNISVWGCHEFQFVLQLNM